MNKTLITLIGPTAIGKTKMAIALAKHYNAHIISADSRQFFKEMSIGTAVPSAEELAAAPHHFIQHKSIHETYTVGDFEKEGIAQLTSLFKNNNTVIMVGGSGLYIDAITDGLNVFPHIDASIRKELNAQFAKEGLAAIQKQLKSLDPWYYNKVDAKNPQRIIRALEVCIGSGQAYSSFLNKPKPKREFSTITLGLKAERALIYHRINLRVDQMMQQGLLEEAKNLLPFKELNALQTVGYKELFAYFEGKWDVDVATEEIKKNTRRFAKRQLTWFLKKKNSFWFDYNENASALVTKINMELEK